MVVRRSNIDHPRACLPQAWRDSMKQERVPISEVERIVGEKVDFRGLLRKF
jgi:hypothetical protein